jgi:SpoVK/Ycf46/Vps4 family AAA+-type ATPase
VPDVVVERDIGSPPPYIDDLMEHVRGELTSPDLHRRYRLRPAQTRLLTGVSGSGKSLSILGVWRRLYELMSEVTGTPIDRLPPRVLRLRMAQVLDKWLGESDKRLDRFFQEVEQLADEPFVAPDGTEWHLPVLAVGEEIEALARARGDGDPIYDRIQTTGLERLDSTCQKFKNRLVIFLFTTNVPHLVDPAFLRRAGGTIERFGRLDRRSFQAVLSKHIRGLPFRADYGEPDQAERRAVRTTTDWLFSPNGHDAGQVALTYVGSSTPVLKYRRDFLTGALVDSAVQQATSQACRATRSGCDAPGLTTEQLIASIDAQVRGIVEQLSAANLHNYLTLPDGVRVGDVRRFRTPSLAPYELEHVA